MALSGRTQNRVVVRIITTLLFCLALLLAAILFLKPEASQDNASKTQSPDSINIGIHISDSPGFSSMHDGQRNGFDIDLANYIADGLGRHPNFIPVTIEGREQQLISRYLELVINTYSISDSRIDKGIIFAGPYMRTYQGIMVNKNNTTINAIGDLAGKTVCVTKGSTTEEKLEELKKNIPLISTERDTFAQCLDDLKNPSTSVSAVTTDAVILQGHAHADPSLKFLPGIVVPGPYEKYGVGMFKANKELCHKVAGLLKSFVNTQWNSAFNANLQLDTAQNVSELKPDPSTIDTESCQTN